MHKAVWIVVVASAGAAAVLHRGEETGRRHVCARSVRRRRPRYADHGVTGRQREGSGGVLVFTLIVAAVHAAILDTDRKAGRWDGSRGLRSEMDC